MNTTLQDTRAAQAMWNHTLSGGKREGISLTIGRREGLGAKLSHAFDAMVRRINSGLPVAAYQPPFPRIG